MRDKKENSKSHLTCKWLLEYKWNVISSGKVLLITQERKSMPAESITTS